MGRAAAALPSGAAVDLSFEDAVECNVDAVLQVLQRTVVGPGGY
jgi:hypothetical protein